MFNFLQAFFNTQVRGLEPKLHSITILREVLYGEIIWGVDKGYYTLYIVQMSAQ